MLRQSTFGRLAGYEGVNDAERLWRDPAMRKIVAGKAVQRGAASASQMGRFETEWFSTGENLAALADLSGQWIDRVHAHRPPKGVILDMDSSVSPAYGEQERRKRCALLTETRVVSGRTKPCLTVEATSAALPYSRLPPGAQTAILTLGTRAHLGIVD